MKIGDSPKLVSSIDPLSGFVVGHNVVHAVALGSRVFGVAADIEVEASPVLQEDVRRSAPAHHPPEEVAGHLVGTEPPLAAQCARDPVFVLDTVDPALHRVSVPRRPS